MRAFITSDNLLRHHSLVGTIALYTAERIAGSDALIKLDFADDNPAIDWSALVELTDEAIPMELENVRYEVTINLGTREVENSTAHIHEIAIEIPYTNDPVIKEMLEVTTEKLCQKIIDLDLLVGYWSDVVERYYYVVDEDFDFDGVYEAICNNASIEEILLDVGFYSESNTFMLSLSDMSQADSIMRYYLKCPPN